MNNKKYEIKEKISNFFQLNKDVIGKDLMNGSCGVNHFYSVGEYEIALEVFLLDIILEKRTEELIFNNKITPSTLIEIAEELDTKDDWCNVSYDGFWDMYRNTFKNMKVK